MENRNHIKRDKWIVCQINKKELRELPHNFCGHSELDMYFKEECHKFEEGLFVKTYKLFSEDAPNVILGLISICNDTLRFEYKQRNRNIPEEKFGLETYPAIKIERFAIRKEFQKLGYGTICGNVF